MKKSIFSNPHLTNLDIEFLAKKLTPVKLETEIANLHSQVKADELPTDPTPTLQKSEVLDYEGNTPAHRDETK